MKKNIFSKKKGNTSAPTKSGASSISKKNKINIALSVLLAIMVCLLITSIVLAVVSDTSNYGGVKGDKGEMGPQGLQGIPGKDGVDGVGIDRIEKTATFDNVDTYFIHYTDGSKTSFKITNGLNCGLFYRKALDSQAPEDPIGGSAVNNFTVDKVYNQRFPQPGDYFILEYSIPNSKGQELVLNQFTECSDVTLLTSNSVNIGAAMFESLGFIDGVNGANGEDGRSIEGVGKSIQESTSEYDLYYVYYSDGSRSAFRIDLPEPGTKWEVLDLDVHRVTGRPTAAQAIVSSSEEILELDHDCYYVANGLICTYIGMNNNANGTITYMFNFHYDLNGVDGADGVDGTNGKDGRSWYPVDMSTWTLDSDGNYTTTAVSTAYKGTDFLFDEKTGKVYTVISKLVNGTDADYVATFVVDLKGKDGADGSASLGLTVGQTIDKLVFNDDISIEKMTEYLSKVNYDDNGMRLLMWVYGEGTGFSAQRTEIYAVDLATHGQVQGTELSGYVIFVLDMGQSIPKQVLFISEYTDNNLAFIQAMGVTNINYSADNYGWINTNDLSLDQYKTYTNESGEVINLTLTAGNFESEKICVFIGTDTKLWEMLSMFN